MEQKLEELPNIGPRLAERLRAIGIKSYSQLSEIGSVRAVIMMNDELGQGCYSTLYALEGAIRGVRWHSLSPEDRAAVKLELDQQVLRK